MGKLGVAIAVVVVGGLAATPYVTGVLIEHKLSGIKALPGMGGGAVWSVDSFQRGYLSSTATSSLTLNTDDEHLVIHFKQEISQVPSWDGSYATIRSVWVPDADVKPKIDKLFNGKEPVVFNTALTVFGDSHTQGIVAPVSVEGVDFSGGKITIDTARSGHFDYGMAIDHFSVQNPESTAPSEAPVVLKGIQLIADGQMSAHNIAWDSQAALKIASASKGTEGALQGFSLSMNSKRTGDDYALTMGFDLDKADLPDMPIAMRDMSHFHYRFSLSRLDAPAIEKLYLQMQQAQQQGVTDTTQLAQAMTATMISELPALLNRGPKFEVNPVRITLPAGDVVLNFSAELPPGHGAEGLSNPTGLLDLLSMKGDFTVPRAALIAALNESGQAADDAQLDTLIQQGYVSFDNGLLKTKFVYKDGHLSINDKPSDNLLGILGAMAPR
ncbi:MAG: YdgA family protein [Halothiobacillaceae bacterium]|nr:YdgA family protein [Halothiobacillaceae bacterium]HUN00327.1 DUF945 family protein [Halothiobacillus sp.]